MQALGNGHGNTVCCCSSDFFNVGCELVHVYLRNIFRLMVTLTKVAENDIVVGSIAAVQTSTGLMLVAVGSMPIVLSF